MIEDDDCPKVIRILFDVKIQLRILLNVKNIYIHKILDNNCSDYVFVVIKISPRKNYSSHERNSQLL